MLLKLGRNLEVIDLPVNRFEPMAALLCRVRKLNVMLMYLLFKHRRR